MMSYALTVLSEKKTVAMTAQSPHSTVTSVRWAGNPCNIKLHDASHAIVHDMARGSFAHVPFIPEANTCHGRCRQNFWQVPAGVSKIFGTCRQVSNMWLVVDMRHTHTDRTLGFGAFLQHRVWCDHRTIVCRREMGTGNLSKPSSMPGHTIRRLSEGRRHSFPLGANLLKWSLTLIRSIRRLSLGI